MSTIEDVTPEELAKLIYHYREALAHDGNGYGIKGETSSWERTPQDERKLMVAAARLTLLELATTPVPKPGRKYYAMPGEAEWGC